MFSMTMSKAEMEKDGTTYGRKPYKRVRDERLAGGAAADMGPYEALFEREAKLGKQAGFTAIVLSKQRDSMIADLKDTKRWTDTLANIYFFRLVPIPLPIAAALGLQCVSFLALYVWFMAICVKRQDKLLSNILITDRQTD